MGGSRREGVSSDEAGVEFPSSLVPLQSRPAYQGVSWCVVLWHGSSAPSAEGVWLASHFLCFKVHGVDRAALCAGRRGSAGVYLGLWEVLRLLSGCPFLHRWDWPPTLVGTSEDEGFGWAVATNTEVPHAPMWYSYKVIYTVGKNLTTADALSRAPVGSPQAADLLFESETAAFVQPVVDGLPATQGRLVEIKTKQQEDQVRSHVAYHCREGWPAGKSKIGPDNRPFFTVREDLTVQEGLTLPH